jgi:malonate-semialdehyde dehydrogenase (acetylating)/methylmalonate-semialdehyde dehydrogenase
MQAGKVLNFVNGKWESSNGSQVLDIHNPASGEVFSQVQLSTTEEVNKAAQFAHQAFLEWRNVPAVERIQYLFKLKGLMEENFDALAEVITLENGKTFKESQGELIRAIENVEVACGIPMLTQGAFNEDIARGIDEFVIRQPVGVSAIIAPFNFPGMIPFWFLPYAVATGNTVIVKPSERTPVTMHKVFELVEKLDLPGGVLNMVHGGPETVNALLDHLLVRAVSFVGSTPVARHIYARSSQNGKRVQAQGGAKNPIFVLPDADMDSAVQIVADSAFGCAGQRCLAASTVITVGDARHAFTEGIADAADERVVGFGMDAGVQMGPVISRKSQNRIEGLIDKAVSEGAQVIVDGRGHKVSGYENGYFIRPTLLDQVNPLGEVAQTEIFGPVLSLIHFDNIDEAISYANKNAFGNMASLFTSSGASARKFRNEIQAGNVGINIGVAAPMAFFPFSGWKDSFFGTLHGQGKHAVEFFTQTKVVIERWPKAWTRKF